MRKPSPCCRVSKKQKKHCLLLIACPGIRRRHVRPALRSSTSDWKQQRVRLLMLSRHIFRPLANRHWRVFVMACSCMTSGLLKTPSTEIKAMSARLQLTHLQTSRLPLDSDSSIHAGSLEKAHQQLLTPFRKLDPRVWWLKGLGLYLRLLVSVGGQGRPQE